MDGRRSDLVEVLRGDGPDGLTWRIVAGGDDDDDFATFVERGRGEFRAASGMRGPKLYPGEVMNRWIGRTDRVPTFGGTFVPDGDPIVELRVSSASP